jgi:NAD(P)-dependent dehydrogenase (short-subunit alcohol dehydrogenase family)
VARALARAGASVVVSARTMRRGERDTREEGMGVRLPGSLEETLAEIEALGARGAALPCDLADAAAVGRVVAETEAMFGSVDILVNSTQAAVIDGAFWETPVAAWDEQMAATPRAYYLAARAAVPGMLARGGGLIANVSSSGSIFRLYSVAYQVGRAAVDRMTQGMAEELEGRGVTILSLWPAMIRTERVEAAVRGESAGIPPMPGYDLAAEANTPDAVGLGIAHVAVDPERARLSGRAFSLGELAGLYGFTDIDGREIQNVGSTRRFGVGDGRLAPPVYDRRGLL